MTSALPSPEKIASLVSGVTEVMIGMSFTIAQPRATPPWQDAPAWRTVLLPIPGARPVTVAVAADERTGKQIGGKIFSCAAADVDDSMLNDTLCELANIIAGQVKSAMGLNQALGLPKLAKEGVQLPGGWQAATLSSGGMEQSFWVAIAEL